MEGKTPAPWFVEVNGRQEGPYTSQEIMKLLMEGALKVESRVFDAAANAWKLAAEVVPYLELGSADGEREWAPPPRPVELRDIHVVDLNQEATGEVDYFALINDRKLEFDKAKAYASRVEQTAINSAASVGSSSNERARTTHPAQRRFAETNRATLSNARRIDPRKIVRVAPPPDEVRPAQVMREVSPSLAAGGILTASADEGSILDFFSRSKRFVTENYRPIAAAAAMAFVFVGTYGVVRSLGDKEENRLPAAAEEKAENPAIVSTKKANARPSVDPLGSGRHRSVSRQTGTASPYNRGDAAPQPAASAAPPANHAPELPPSSEAPTPLREEPQFVSLREIREQQQAPAQPVTLPPPVPRPSQPEYSDANAGFVDAPGYIPPPADASGNDPNRFPTSDPNAAAADLNNPNQ